MWKPEVVRRLYQETRYQLFRVNPELVLKRQFKWHMGYPLNLDNPKTFNEKLQWLKLYWRDERATQLADKYLVRDYVESKGLGHLLNDLYGVYDDPEEIDPEKLPNEFVIKPNHSSGKVLFCRDKKKYDWTSARHLLNKWLKSNLYRTTFEWVYEKIPSKILVEKLIKTENGEPPRDYKFFCFSGKPIFCGVYSHRGLESQKADFYDLDWVRLPFCSTYPNSEKDIPRPGELEKMINYASMLSSGFPHLRIDFYSEDNKVTFGECTFFVASGFIPFNPIDFDYRFGEHIKLPNKHFLVKGFSEL